MFSVMMDVLGGCFGEECWWWPARTPLPGASGVTGGVWVSSLVVWFMCLFIGPLPYHCHCYPHSPSHRKAFTQKTFYTEDLLHRKPFTQKTFYTRKPFTQKTFYTRRAFTQKILRNPRIKTLSGPLGKHSPSLYSHDSQESWDYDGGKLPHRSWMRALRGPIWDSFLKHSP